MAYMVYQRYATAIQDGYGAGSVPDVEQQLASARAARVWLESLEIDPSIRASLVEPIGIVEDAFESIVRTVARLDAMHPSRTPSVTERDP